MQILPRKLQWIALYRISCSTCNIMTLSMSQAGFWEQGSRTWWKIYSLNKHKIISQYFLGIYTRQQHQGCWKLWGSFYLFGEAPLCTQIQSFTSSGCSPQLRGQTSFLWWELRFLLYHTTLAAKVFLKTTKYLGIHNISTSTINRRLPKGISDSNSTFFLFINPMTYCVS